MSSSQLGNGLGLCVHSCSFCYFLVWSNYLCPPDLLSYWTAYVYATSGIHERASTHASISSLPLYRYVWFVFPQLLYHNYFLQTFSHHIGNLLNVFLPKTFCRPLYPMNGCLLLDTYFSFISELSWFSKNIKEKPSRSKNISKYTPPKKIKQEDLELKNLVSQWHHLIFLWTRIWVCIPFSDFL